MNRIIVLIDMDCFYCQVEAKINPALQGKPVVVAQRTELKDRPLGRIIAVNYEAKAKGVTRQMLASEAKQICPDLEVVAITQSRGKADLNKYRDASKEISEILMDFCSLVEKASIDEAYLDITDIILNQFLEKSPMVTEDRLYNTYVVGYEDVYEDGSYKSTGVKELLHDAYHSELKDNNLLHLSLGALFVQQIREAIYAKTGFRCSAGISHNKILAKIVCGLHKPNCQTILPYSGVSVLYRTLPLKKVRSLGGQFGDIVMKELNCSVMGDVSKYSLKELEKKFPHKTAQWLFEVSRGIDLTPVKYRMICNSISCCKKFPGTSALKTKKDVQHWINELANELKTRLDNDIVMNKRRGTLLTVRYQHNESSSTALSKSAPLPSYDLNKIVELTERQLIPLNRSSASDLWLPAFCYLGICVAKFHDYHNENSIRNFMKPQAEYQFQNAALRGQQTVCHEPNNINSNSKDEELNSHTRNNDDNSYSNDNNNSNKNCDFSKSFFVRYFKKIENDTVRNRVEDNNNNDDDDDNQIYKNETTIKTDLHVSRTTNDVDDAINLIDEINRASAVDDCNDDRSSTDNVSLLPIYNENSNISNDYNEYYDNSNSISSNSSSTVKESYPEDFYDNCPRCNKRISIIQLENHIDHHVALELHRQLNPGGSIIDIENDSSNRAVIQRKKLVENKRKRKSKITSDGGKTKGILSFFQVR